MEIPLYKSIKSIQKQYKTGETPVLVVCSDLHEYVCKYKHSSGSAYKLVCELSGAILAKAWNLNIPKFAFIQILPEHWTPMRSVSLTAPAFGSRILDSVIDVTATFDKEIHLSSQLIEQIMHIALFDLWVSNEDRNWNNANLLYDMTSGGLVVIDHGCIFNTATFDFKLSILTQNETILYSDLAHKILNETTYEMPDIILEKLQKKFYDIKESESELVGEIMDNIPALWNVDREVVKSKIRELFDRNWMQDCWQAFVEYVNENRNG